MHRDQALSFLDINVGDKAEFKVLIDKDMHDAFSVLSGDFSPIHCNDKFCVKTKFKKKIGYAFMLTSFLSRLYGEYLPGGSSICIRQEANFVRPFFIGDNIIIAGKVISKIISTKFIEIDSRMYRNESQCVFRGKGIVQLLF